MKDQKIKTKTEQVKVLLRLDKGLKSDIEALSFGNDRSVNSEIIQAIRFYVKSHTL